MRLLIVTALVVAFSPALQTSLSAQSGRGLPTMAPYKDIVWPAPPSETPRVLIGVEWFELLSINSVPVADIVATARRGFGGDWQRRFDEDLFEVMSIMERAPGATVTLGLRDPANEQTSTCSNVPNTSENRQAIWRARWIRDGRLPPDTPPVAGLSSENICE